MLAYALLLIRVRYQEAFLNQPLIKPLMKGEAGMKKRSLVLLTVLVFLVSVVSSAVAGTSILDEVKKRGVIRIGSGTTVPPVNYIDKEGNWTGFDIEIGDEIGKRLGVKVERVNVNNKTRIAFLANRSFDLTASSTGNTTRRDEQVV